MKRRPLWPWEAAKRFREEKVVKFEYGGGVWSNVTNWPAVVTTWTVTNT